MKFFRKKEPRIILYMLYKDPEYKELVYICANKDEIEEFTTKKILLDNYLHYSSWCKLRNYKEDDKHAQNEYVENLLLESEKAREEYNYYLAEVNITRQSVAGIFRIINGISPVGCSFETRAEYNFLSLLSNVYKESAKK